MNNQERYNQAFEQAFGKPVTQTETLSSDRVEGWDSVGQMILVDLIEKEFAVQLKPRDIMGFTSYRKGVAILSDYGIHINIDK